MPALGINIFRDSINFFFELKENMRTKPKAQGIQPDLPYLQSLSHLRMGALNDDDVMCLSSLFCSPSYCLDNPMHKKEIWLFAYKKNVKAHNKICLERLLATNFGIRIVSKHFRNVTSGGHKIRQFANAAIEQNLLEIVRDDRQHAAYIDLCIGSRVKCTENLLIPVGLCNGSQGTVVGFMFSKPQRADFVCFPEFQHLAQDSADREIPIVLVQFDFKEDDPVALERAKRYSYLEDVPNVFPICASVSVANVNIQIEIEGQKQVYSRLQLPLAPGHARTGHSTQGITAYYGVVLNDLNSCFFAFPYVGASRAQSRSSTRLINPVHIFKKEYAHPKHAMRDDVDKFYAVLRARFPRPLFI